MDILLILFFIIFLSFLFFLDASKRNVAKDEGLIREKKKKRGGKTFFLRGRSTFTRPGGFAWQAPPEHSMDEQENIYYRDRIGRREEMKAFGIWYSAS